MRPRLWSLRQLPQQASDPINTIETGQAHAIVSPICHTCMVSGSACQTRPESPRRLWIQRVPRTLVEGRRVELLMSLVHKTSRIYRMLPFLKVRSIPGTSPVMIRANNFTLLDLLVRGRLSSRNLPSWARRESNPYVFRHRDLNPAWLPVTPLAHALHFYHDKWE